MIRSWETTEDMPVATTRAARCFSGFLFKADYLIGLDIQGFGLPGTGRQAGFQAEATEKIVRPGQLFPYLRQKSRPFEPLADDDAVHVGPQFLDEVVPTVVFQRERIGQDTDLDMYLVQFRFRERAETRVVKSSADGVLPHAVA